jgi:glucose/arabinose dehydrogenase
MVASSACDPIILPPLDPGGPATVEGVVEELLPEANFPVAIAFAPDGSAYYTEKETGRIRMLTAEGELLAEPFADVTVVANSERGLLGVALHPDFADNGLVYAFYTSSNLAADSRDSGAAVDNRVVRFTSNEARTESTSEELIISLPVAPGPNHNGGNIHFGPDEKLYITFGDLAEGSNAQDLNALPGRILRLNDDGSIPVDNPFGPDNPAFALGLRNSFDFAFDPESDVIFATENGTNQHDEINRLPARANGGWSRVEGSAEEPPEVTAGFYVDPVYEYQGIVAPTGIAFAPDATFGTSRESHLFVGEFLTGRVWMFSVSNDRETISPGDVFVQGLAGGITDLAFAPDGTLFVLTSTKIYRVVPEEQ